MLVEWASIFISNVPVSFQLMDTESEFAPCAPSKAHILVCQPLSQETQCLMWWQPSECPEDLARSNWEAAFISLMELHILWLGWSQIAESTGTWLWQSAPCQVAYPIVSVATNELSESVLLAVSIAPKGILLLLQWHCIRILNCSLRPNMRVANCKNYWKAVEIGSW